MNLLRALVVVYCAWQLKELLKHNIVYIDGARSKDDVYEDVKKIVLQHLQ